MDVPRAWKNIDLTTTHKGTVLIVGGPDTGKSTFAQWLYAESSAAGYRTAFIDGDPGQSMVGPPTTVSMMIGKPGDNTFPPTGSLWLRFVGSTSPVRHMLPILSAAGRLVEEAHLQRADRIIYDTTGLIDKRVGGVTLKLALIDLLQPDSVVAFQKDNELRPLIEFLRRTSQSKLYELEPVQGIRRRYMQDRQTHRRTMYEQYFVNVVESELEWTEIAVSPEPHFNRNQLAALQDRQGYVLTLWIIDDIDTKEKRLKLLAPYPISEFHGRIDSLCLGSLSLDPESFREQWL